MARRTWVFLVAGALLIGASALLYGLGLQPPGCSGPAIYVEDSFCPARLEILWFELSEAEAIVWLTLIGIAMGALLGLLVGNGRGIAEARLSATEAGR